MKDIWDEMSYHIYKNISQHDRLRYEYEEDIYELVDYVDDDEE